MSTHIIDADGYCTISDLPAGQCADCPGATTFSAPILDQVRPALPTATIARPGAHRRRLPILGYGAGNGTVEYDVHDMFDELTRAHGHSERYVAQRNGESWNSQHVTDVPALVHQLLGAAPSGSGEQSGSTPHSRPAARIEALDTLMLIDDEAERWILRLGDNPPGDSLDPQTHRPIPGSGTIAKLRRVHALLASQRRCTRIAGRRDEAGAWCCAAHRIEYDVRRWWHQARIITGWDTAAYRPYSACPVCEHRGGLRINLAMHAGFCVECRSVWTRDTIGVLADHIRGEGPDTPDSATA